MVLSPEWLPTLAGGLPQTEAAVACAERLHLGQRQGDGTPYLLHPLEVARLLHDAGAPDHLIAAGALHDVLEKSDMRESDLRRRFGARITALVLAVSDDDRITVYARRKAALRQQVASAGDDAMALFAADKLSRLRELGRERALDGEGSRAVARVRTLRAHRLRHYQRSLAMLEERLPESSLVRDLRHELDAFMRQPATI
jgi:(p)ppGpp synthase/HD superfamily hydrolase